MLNEVLIGSRYAFHYRFCHELSKKYTLKSAKNLTREIYRKNLD